MNYINREDLLNGAFNTDKFQFRIGELSTMAGVSTRQLRYWESKEIIHAVTRDGEQDARVYKFHTVARVMTIKGYLDEGYTLKAAVKKAEAMVDVWKILHTVMKNVMQGVAEIDGKQAVDMGFFDDAKTQRLYAYMDEETNGIKFLVRDANE
ncbi:MAG: MerR family transcriptional regulator [Lactobacillaceae bacterium]|jgi:DNA-binding transcriptional MerR regulator|nr:MerR family transcriptional regulator [Lactobacillaceae bacterium]